MFDIFQNKLDTSLYIAIKGTSSKKNSKKWGTPNKGGLLKQVTPMEQAI